MERKAHWLRRNAASRVPRRIITFDCEADKAISLAGERHNFRLAVAAFDLLDENGRPEAETVWYETEDAADLWRWIIERTSTKHRTVVFAHNLSYDVRLSNALTHIPGYGFECKGIALTSYSFWARWQGKGRTLWLCDSLSFAPASLEVIAKTAKLRKAKLPSDDADNPEWFKRCRSDVKITRQVVLRTIAYIKSNDLGDYRLTGAAQSSAAFRHRFLRERTLLVHDNQEALLAERRATHAGRAEVWLHGKRSELLYEYDYQYAYARLAFQLDLPMRFVAEHSPLPQPRMERMMQHYAVLADCIVTTSMPTVPTSNGTHVIWPSGEFRTTLWDHELRLLSSSNATYKVERFWYYKRGPLLKEWAAWIMGELDKPGDELDPIVRLMLKDWSRALIGRFGLRYSEIDEIAKLKTSDVKQFGVACMDTGEKLDYLQLGTQLFERMGRTESPNSTPMVMSAVMSAARVRLWRTMQVCGLENVVYVDTDGVITTTEGANRLDIAIARGELEGLHCKHRFNGGWFRAPRNIDLGQQRRVNGAPRKAERLAPSIYRGEVWESLPTALNRGNVDRVFLHNRTFEVSDSDPRRIHLPGGTTEAIQLA